MVAFWTRVWALTTALAPGSVQSEQVEKTISWLLPRGGKSCTAYLTFQFFQVLPEGLASISPFSECSGTWHMQDHWEQQITETTF